jgi:cytoskeletal protein CcmA (bactofilin family)
MISHTATHSLFTGRNFASVILFLTFLLGVPSALMAYSVKQGNSVYVGKDETVEGNLYAFASTITIDGHVTGDLICAGQTVTVNGTVEGDIIALTQNLVVEGPVGGSIRVAGSSIHINNKVARSLTAMGSNVNLTDKSAVGWDSLIVAGSSQLNGSLGRSLLGAGATFFLNGPVGQDVILYMGSDNQMGNAGSLTLADSARIAGRMEYTGIKDAEISSKAHIAGEVIHNPPSPEKESHRRFPVVGALGWILVSTLSAMLVGLILVKIMAPVMTELSNNMVLRFWPTFGWGALWTIVPPILALFVAMTIVGLRLAFLSFGIWLILTGVAKIIAAIVIGQLILRKYWAAKKDSPMIAALFGLLLSWPVFHIPFVGWILSLTALFWGMGGICLFMKKKYDSGKSLQ